MRNRSYKEEFIWIIGASSGIGVELAKELASRGAILALSARRKEALEKLRDRLGNQHKIFVVDVIEAEGMVRTAQTIRDVFGRIDRIIFLAAAYKPMKLECLDLSITRQMVEVNLLGALHTLHAALPILKDQNQGQIALCGSVSGYVGLPGGQPYSATKAAVLNLAESLKNECKPSIDVKLISPGFVRTRLTDQNNFDMPMIMSPEKASKYIAEGLLKRSFEVHFPKRLTLGLKLLRILPYSLLWKIFRKSKEGS